MSIWAEIKHAINSTLGTATFKPLNEQLRDLKFQEIKIITSSGTYTPTKTGLYKVICVGAGGDGFASSPSSSTEASCGGGGGVAISTLTLSSSGSYTVTVSSTASFVYSDEITLTATAGGDGSSSGGGSGGTASGGDNNYSGTAGKSTTSSLYYLSPGSVGVFISELSQTHHAVGTLTTADGQSVVNLAYGDCILNYGGGGNAMKYYGGSSYKDTFSFSGKPAAIIIVPLELEG